MMSRSIANQYDILGLAPGASGDDIETAFDRLIRRGGFRAGLPFFRRPQRVWEIMTAYEMLRDPAKRRAYDELLHQPADSLVGARQGTDTATDSLVRPIERRPPPETVANETTMAAPIAARAAQSASVRPAELRQEPAPSRTEASAGTTDPSAVADVPDRERAAPAGAYWTSRRVPVRNWGVAAAVTLAFGIALFAFWPSGEPQPSPADNMRRSPVSAQQNTPGNSSPGFQSAAAGSGEALNREDQPAAAVDAAAASAGSDRATGNEIPIQPNGSNSVVAQPDSPAASAPTDAPAGAAQEAPAPTTSSSPAASATTPAQAGPPAAAAGGQPAANSIVSPPTWLGSGPTDSDNPNGRYQGSVAVQLTVDPKGGVSSCKVARPSGDAELDAVTCRVFVQRARFNPARDAQGRSVPGQAFATYVWSRAQRPKN